MTVDVSRRKLLQMFGMGALAGLLVACSSKSPLKFRQGDRLPDIELFTMDGGVVSLSTFSGAALVLNFWASWCEPCRREMPSLQKLSGLFAPKELMVVGVTVDSDLNLAREFILQHGLAFQMLSDKDMKVANEILGIPGFPMTYLLTRDRTISRIVVGERNWVEPKSIEEIESLLGVQRIQAA